MKFIDIKMYGTRVKNMCIFVISLCSLLPSLRNGSTISDTAGSATGTEVIES